jgi:hypothetical protein
VKAKTKKVPVTMRALLQRLNRKKKGIVIRKARGGTSGIGEYYAVNTNKNVIKKTHVDPVEWGRKWGVLRKWEAVVGE